MGKRYRKGKRYREAEIVTADHLDGLIVFYCIICCWLCTLVDEERRGHERS